MTIDQFIRKWAPSDLKVIQEFQNDLFQTYKGNDYQKVALEVLTAPSHTCLKIESNKDDVTISYGHVDYPDCAMKYMVPVGIGIEGRDWLSFLQYIAANAVQYITPRKTN